MATIKDVARLADVSISTVSALLNGTAGVSPELAARIRKAMEELDYTPSAQARSLKRGVTRLIGLVVADITNPFFGDMVEAIESEAHRSGYSLMLTNSAMDVAKEREYLKLMQSHRVDGLIMTVAGGASRQTLVEFQKTKIPLVLVDRTFEGLTYDAVLLDNHAAAWEATRFILSLGHQRIGLVSGPRDLSTGEERARGHLDALEAAGVPADPALIVEGGFTIDGGVAATRALLALPDRPTALFSANNLMAIGMMRCVAASGLSCPGDVSVMTIDDFPWAEAFMPRLTTVAQPVREMGRRAVRMLIERIEKRAPGAVVQHIFAPSLCIRDSCIRH